MLEELIDRFAEPPKSVTNLLRIACLKARAHRLYIREVIQKGEELKLVMYERAKINPAKIPELIGADTPALSFTADSKNPYFTYRMNINSREKSGDILDVLENLLLEMECLLPESPVPEENG